MHSDDLVFIYSEKLSLSLLNKLNEIDWLRKNPEWLGRIFNAQGKITGKEDSIIKICNLMKKKLSISLSKEETAKEKELI